MIVRVSIYHLIVCVCIGFNIALADERLDVLKRISAAGAPALTLKMLDQAQPSIDTDLYEWIVWEQERYRILTQWQQWNRLLIRLEALPINIPDQFKHQSITYKAQTYMELGQTSTARKILRQQLWQTAPDQVSEYQTWRRMIIASYLKDDRTEDARIAMLRFDQDFSSEDEAWLQLRATVFIQTGRFEQAIQILQKQKSWQAQSMVLLARLRAELIKPSELWKLVKKQAAKKGLEADQLATLWALGFYASENMSPVDRVVALENYFKHASETILPIFKIKADALWQAYIDYARLIGNRSEMLIGDDDKWLDLAKSASKKTPVKARSLYALLINYSSDSEAINRAASGYLQTFGSIDEAEQNQLDHLFNRSETFADAGLIPPTMRYQLVDLALNNANIDEATRLMSGLTTYPEGTSRLNWQLRQSRVLILGGQYEEGNQIMQALLTEYKEPNIEDTDRILQVLFDLQTVSLHESVIQHFNRLLGVAIEPRQHREILFWIGDSYKALGKFDQAALLYLQSAMLPAPDAMDPWAQTARFNAAESLQKSGLVDDARRIYQVLLNVTDDPVRRAVLNHNIQQLWLKQNPQ